MPTPLGRARTATTSTRPSRAVDLYDGVFKIAQATMISMPTATVSNSTTTATTMAQPSTTMRPSPYDGIDNDCIDGDLTDVDGDGYEGGPSGTDCDDEDATRNRGRPKARESR